MSIKVESTTDTAENVAAANGEKVDANPEVKVDETKSASEVANTEDETKLEASETSEEQEDEAEELEPEQKATKPKNGYKKRIDKLTSQKTAAEQERDYWRQEALKSKQPEGKAEPVERKDDEGKPNKDDYESLDDYYEDLSDWKVEQKLKAKEEKENLERAKTAEQEQVKSFATKAQEFKKTHEDFDEIMEGVNDVRMSIAVQDLLVRAANGPELAYELAKDPEEFARVCQLSPMEAAEEIGKLKFKLQSKAETSSKPETKISKAPPPIKPIGSGGSSGAKKSIYDPNISFKEYERIRAEELKAKTA